MRNRQPFQRDQGINARGEAVLGKKGGERLLAEIDGFAAVLAGTAGNEFAEVKLVQTGGVGDCGPQCGALRGTPADADIAIGQRKVLRFRPGRALRR